MCLAGAQIAACVAAFPRLSMSASLHPITRTVLRVQLTIKADFEWRERGHGQALRWLILVEDSANEHIYHSEVGRG
jgi:activating signal cointegrator complex subunit 3